MQEIKLYIHGRPRGEIGGETVLRGGWPVVGCGWLASGAGTVSCRGTCRGGTYGVRPVGDGMFLPLGGLAIRAGGGDSDAKVGPPSSGGSGRVRSLPCSAVRAASGDGGAYSAGTRRGRRR
jgi:hypothetical protein